MKQKALIHVIVPYFRRWFSWQSLTELRRRWPKPMTSNRETNTLSLLWRNWKGNQNKNTQQGKGDTSIASTKKPGWGEVVPSRKHVCSAFILRPRSAKSRSSRMKWHWRHHVTLPTPLTWSDHVIWPMSDHMTTDVETPICPNQRICFKLGSSWDTTTVWFSFLQRSQVSTIIIVAMTFFLVDTGSARGTTWMRRSCIRQCLVSQQVCSFTSHSSSMKLSFFSLSKLLTSDRRQKQNVRPSGGLRKTSPMLRATHKTMEGWLFGEGKRWV